MKQRLYHGTTWANWLLLQANGFGSTAPTSNWTCSCENLLYFFSLDKVKLEYEADPESFCIENGFWNARLAAAVEGGFETKLVVLECEVDESFLTDDPDSDLAVAVTLTDLRFEDIKRVYLAIEGYEPSLRLFVLREVAKSELLDLKLTTLEQRALSSIEEFYLSDEVEFKWEVLK